MIIGDFVTVRLSPMGGGSFIDEIQCEVLAVQDDLVQVNLVDDGGVSWIKWCRIAENGDLWLDPITTFDRS